MTFTAFLLIIASATLHASWNLLAKKSKATLPFYATVSTVATLVWTHCQFWTPIKLWELPLLFWLFACGSVMGDTLYAIGLVRCYRTMEMSSAYPMMRSLPLLLIFVITTVLGLGKTPTLLAALGMGIVFIGCMMIPLLKFSDFNLSRYWNKSMIFLLVVACGTTGYTIFDSLSQQVIRSVLPEISKPVVAMTYYSTRGLMLAAVLWTIIFSSRVERENAKALITGREWNAVFAGFAASGTYILVLIAMNYVNNVSYVQVFRQIGLLIGMAAGIIILKEKFTIPKLVGVILIILGLAMTVI